MTYITHSDYWKMMREKARSPSGDADDDAIIKAFRDLGVKKTSLIKDALAERGRDWMQKLLYLIDVRDARGEIKSRAAFAVKALLNPTKVDLNDTSGFKPIQMTERVQPKRSPRPARTPWRQDLR